MNADLVAQATVLRSTVRRHKAAIAKHRTELRQAAAALAAIEADCKRLGIGFDRQSRTHGEGNIHGQSDPTT